MKKPQVFSLLILCVGIGVGILFIVGWNTKDVTRDDENSLDNGAWQLLSTPQQEQETNSTSTDESAIVSRNDDGKPDISQGAKRYVNDTHKFSFVAPAGVQMSALNDDAGEVVLADGAGIHFQIFIMPWDEPEGVLTPERIRKDLPHLKIVNPQVVIVGDDIRALMFESEDETTGKTREVWLVHNGSLYQITAPFASDAALAYTMQSWRFEQ